ncbi:MAG TPA: HTH-type transcriptional regulator Hpr [Firmicutes bacterium]|nr:HTH-type transcriptional regulator Hpr [Bacillota bacterium]
MKMTQHSEIKEALLFTHRIAQLSKAVWKAVEKDWQQWIKPYDLNINEHHIIWITHHLKGASVSEIAKFGIMHISTAFNFSKKLEERGYIIFSKNENDKRNTYVRLSEKGEELYSNLVETFNKNESSIYQAALPLKELFGKFPTLLELNGMVHTLYGEDFMNITEHSLVNINEEFEEVDGNLKTKKDFNPTRTERILK